MATKAKTKSLIGLSEADGREGRAYWLPDRPSSVKISAVAAYEAAMAKIAETDEEVPTLGDFDDLGDIEVKF